MNYQERNISEQDFFWLINSEKDKEDFFFFILIVVSGYLKVHLVGGESIEDKKWRREKSFLGLFDTLIGWFSHFLECDFNGPNMMDNFFLLKMTCRFSD